MVGELLVVWGEKPPHMGIWCQSSISVKWKEVKFILTTLLTGCKVGGNWAKMADCI